MYGKEIEPKINIQSGGQNINMNIMEKNVRHIMEPQETSLKKTFVTLIQLKWVRVSCMIVFFLFFHKLLKKIFHFFDIDEIYSNTYMLWISIIVIFYTLLPIKRGYLPKSSTNTISTTQTILFFITIFMSCVTLLYGIYIRH
tara:strand:- start:118 stop:543 length:426 start_codon:yes stop_codon:yes gene_type:complete